MTTPDYTADLAARAAALVPATWSVSTNRNTWAGPEAPSVGAVPLKALFVLPSGERPILHGSGQFRFLKAQLLMRWSADDFAGGEAAMRALYDALHLSGSFTGAVSGATFLDVRGEVGGPTWVGQGDNQAHYFSWNVEVWFDG